MMMSCTLQLLNIGLLVVVTVVAAKIIGKWVFKTPIRSSSKRLGLPPVVKGGLPFIGALLRFLKNPVKMLNEEYLNLGSVFTLNVVNKNITFLLEPDVCTHFFTAPESELSQAQVYRFTVPIFGPGVFYDAEYSVRQDQFRFFEEALRINNLRGFVDVMIQEVQDYFSKWGDNGEVDLKEVMEHLMILIASRCFLGKEVRDRLSGNITALMNEVNIALVPLTTIFPYLPIPPHFRRDKARKKLDEVFSNIITRRKSSGKSENDMLQCLIDSKYKDGRATTVGEVTGLLVTALFGGQRTGAATSIWTGACLLHNKKHWVAAIEEQTTLMEKHGNKLDHDVLTEMQVLYRSIKEALRLYPPNSFILRQNHTDHTVITREGTKYEIPKGHIIATSPFFTNRLSHIYKDPDNYDPERFSPERNEDKLAGPYSFMSFGGGKHSCLGQPFAYLMIKAIWSYLLRNFNLDLVSSFPEIERNDIVWSVKGKVMVRWNRRKLLV